MTTDERSPAPSASVAQPFVRQKSSKIRDHHRQKLSIVYVRQSSPQQILENRESTARQYALANDAVALGWTRDRVLVIDEDQGQSGARAEHRLGFQRLLAEVTMDHVGLVLGLEMSRLARSSKDWHHLLEVCGLFGTLLADQDGVYDPGDPNDRLLLGLTGIMSEVELHTMRNRLERGRMNKAQRGELFHGVPMGCVILPSGEVEFDPDEQARTVIRMAFEKFDESGSLYSLFHYLVKQGIRMPARVRKGARRGQLEWRRPSLPSLSQVFHHPIYAGAYSYGRRLTDAKHTYGPRGRRARRWGAIDEWKVLVRDRLPAYITWDRYISNLERLKRNQTGLGTLGAPRDGLALLPGLITCGTCGRRMQVSSATKHKAYYSRARYLIEATEQTCYGLKAEVIDTLVSRQVLRALEPAALELSLRARGDVQRGRERLSKHREQRLQRAHYDAELAERRYQAVDPENRLVAATLEKHREQALREERQLRDEYDRFLHEAPPDLSEEESARIAALASDIPVLWKAPGTTNSDRREIIRRLIDRVVVHVGRGSEYVEATIGWGGGYASHHEVARPVATYAQLRDGDRLMERVVGLRRAGGTATTIAETLNAEGFSPPKRRGHFNKPIVQQLLVRRGLVGDERTHGEPLGPHEWWLVDLACKLQVNSLKLRDWICRGWVTARQTPVQGYWIAWADEQEIQRLRELRTRSRRGSTGYPQDLTTPRKPDPAQ